MAMVSTAWGITTSAITYHVSSNPGKRLYLLLFIVLCVHLLRIKNSRAINSFRTWYRP
jgi:hypothetical protein